MGGGKIGISVGREERAILITTKIDNLYNSSVLKQFDTTRIWLV